MRNSYKYLGTALVALPLVLGSCGVLRKYRAPEMTGQQQEHLYRDAAAGDTASLADLHWREVFTDPHLQQLIGEALQHNYDLKNAVLQIAQAEATLMQSRWALFPTLNFAPQINHSKTSRAALNLPPTVNIRLRTTTIQLGFSSTWELDVWGKLASGRRASLAGYWQADATRKAVETSLIANVAGMYYTLLALDEQLAITESTVQIREKTMNSMKALKEAAVVTGAAVVQSEANWYAAQVSIPDLKQNIRETENALSVLLGRTPQPVARGKLTDAVTEHRIAAGVPVQLLTRRPDVQAAEFAFRKAFENTNVAKAQFYPSFTITAANAGLSALTHNNLFSESIFYNFIGGLTQPILNRGAIRANHRIANAQQEQAWNTFQKTILTAGQEVSDALFAYSAGVNKMEARHKQIAALEKAVHYNMQLLEYSSTTNYTDVLTSEQSLLQARLSLVSDRLQQTRAIVELYRALGGGWE